MDLQTRFTDKWKNTQISVKEIINVTKNRTKFSTTVKSARALPKQEESENVEVSRGTETTSAQTLLDRIDVNEVRECAKTVGEFNISDDDIKYGLLYGRSVIAEYLC